MTIDRIAIWVHPLWSMRDLGEAKANFWQRNIERFAKDERYGFVLVGQPTNNCDNELWASRIVPMIDTLPNQFGRRYIRWDENYVDSTSKEHVKRLCTQFELQEPEFFQNQYPKSPIFVEGKIDGLIPGRDFCVGQQIRNIQYLVRALETRFWQD